MRPESRVRGEKNPANAQQQPHDAADEAGGYYLDFNFARIRSDKFLEASRPWDVHPTVVGHDLIAQVLCEYLENQG